MTQSSGPDPFEFLKMMWGPMGLPLPGMVTPTLNVNEIDKRIAELRSVESWLTMNLNMLKMALQGMEMQRATLTAIQGQFGDAGTTRPDAGAAVPGATGNPFADAWWNVLQQSQSAPPKDQDKSKKK